MKIEIDGRKRVGYTVKIEIPEEWDIVKDGNLRHGDMIFTFNNDSFENILDADCGKPVDMFYAVIRQKGGKN